jgi:hypothetical protein
MRTEAGLPGWFPEDFKTDPELHAAFDDAAAWHSAGTGKAGRKPKGRKAAAAKTQRRETSMSVTWDDLAAVIEMASAGGHHIAGTPDTYSHGWKLRGIQDGKKELHDKLPTADKMSVTALKAHMSKHHASGINAGGRRVGKKNPSKDDLLAVHEAMHANEPLSVNPPGTADTSALKGGFSRISQAHTHGVPGVADHPVTGIALSAETGRLASTPAPYGKPGGPGLYGVKGLKHSDYLEQVVQALMRKGMDKGKATAIARGSIRKWMAKSKHPEVRAAAGLAETQEIAAQARAHAHANTRPAVELVGPKGFIHGWIHVGTDDMAPEDKADRMSRNLSGHSFGDGPDGNEARSANREAAKAHRQAARLTSSPAAVAHHEKMARLHSAVAGGKMYAANAGKQMSFAYGWDDVAGVIEFAVVSSSAGGGRAAQGGQQQGGGRSAAQQAEARVPAGQAGGGRFGSGGGSTAPAGAKQGNGKATAAAKAHAAHVAHIAHLNHVSTAKAGMIATAADDRAKAAGLIRQRDALMKAMASAGGKTSAGQAGAKTAKTATTKTTAPAVAATAPAAKAGTAPAKAGTATAKTASAPKAGSAAAMKAQIAGLNTQITSLLAAAAAATMQASKMQ